MAKDKKKKTEAEAEPGFFSDYGYGKGTALTILHDPAKPAKDAGKKGTKSKRK